MDRYRVSVHPLNPQASLHFLVTADNEARAVERVLSSLPSEAGPGTSRSNIREIKVSQDYATVLDVLP